MAVPTPNRARPLVLLITGAPGSGKTTLGVTLSRAVRVPFLARDDVRGGLFFAAGAWGPAPERVPGAEESVDTFLRVVEAMAGLGVSCIVEYVVRSSRPGDLQRMETVGDCRVLFTSCRDGEARAARRDRADPLLNRRPVLDALGYPSIEAHNRAAIERMRAVRDDMRTDFDLPVLGVDTSDGYIPGLDAIVEFVTSRR